MSRQNLISGPHYFHPTGSTGNNTSGSDAGAYQVLPGNNAVAFQIVVEAIGATPTADFTFEGSLDGSKWFPVLYITDSSDTAAATTLTKTTADTWVLFLSNSPSRNYRFWRCRVENNTNVTYRTELWIID